MDRLFRTVRLALAVMAVGMTGQLTLCTTAVATPKGIAPAGNSGVSQYIEDLPTAEGDRPTSAIVKPPVGGPRGPTGASGAILPQHVITLLNRAGNSGKAATAIIEATAPTAGRANPAPGPAKRPASTASQLVKTLGGSTGGGGFGAFLPTLLIAILVIVSAAGIFSRRRMR
jgi:hypothetical protein